MCLKTGWQKVRTLIRYLLLQCLIWVSSVYWGLSIWMLLVNHVLQIKVSGIKLFVITAKFFALYHPPPTATKLFSIGIKHGFSCINIRQVPREVLKSRLEAAVFSTSQGTWRMLMHWKSMFDRYYCIKTENISHYFLHYFVLPFHQCLANAIFMDCACSRAGQYTSRNGSKSMALVRPYWKLRSHALTARELPF